MPVSGFYWNDGWLRAAAAESYRIAIVESAGYMASRTAWGHVRSTIHPTVDGVAVGSSHAGLLEGGARSHAIEGGGQVVKFANGSFATGPIDHPGFGGSPFMRPTAEAWPAIYTQTAKRVFPG